jgi:multidrug efflux pump subunit AcrA (membrane-fusion protein)
MVPSAPKGTSSEADTVDDMQLPCVCQISPMTSANRRPVGLRWLIVTLLVAGAAGACGRFDGASGGAGGLLRRAPFERRLLLSGQLEAERATTLQAPSTPAGNVQIRWLAAEGAEVLAGDRIVELDPSELLQGLSERESEQLTAGDELQRLRAQGKSSLEARLLAQAQAEAELEKAELGAAVPRELVSARDLAERELRREKAEAGVAKAAAELDAARAAGASDTGVQRLAAESIDRALAETRRNLDLLTLEAPRPGVVVVGSHPWEGRKFQVGDSVWPGFPLASIPELDSLILVAELSDVDDGRLAPGMSGQCVLDAFPEAPVACSVREIAPMAQEVALPSLRRAFRTVVTLELVDTTRFRPGMSARAEIQLENVAEALLVRRSAVDLAAEPPRVRLVSGELRSIELGACNASDCIILAGLDGSERLLPSPAPAGVPR